MIQILKLLIIYLRSLGFWEPAGSIEYLSIYIFICICWWKQRYTALTIIGLKSAGFATLILAASLSAVLQILCDTTSPWNISSYSLPNIKKPIATSRNVCTWSIWDTTSERRECRVESSLPRSIYPSKPAVLEIVSGFEISSKKRCILVHSCSRNWFMKDMYSSLLPNLKTNKGREGKQWQRKMGKLDFGKVWLKLIKIDSKTPKTHSLGEVGQILGDFSDERERTCRAVVGVLLHQIEKWRGHDGRTEKPQEQGRTDQTLADIRSTPVAAFLPPWRKHLFQFSWENTIENQRQDRECFLNTGPKNDLYFTSTWIGFYL